MALRKKTGGRSRKRVAIKVRMPIAPSLGGNVGGLLGVQPTAGSLATASQGLFHPVTAGLGNSLMSPGSSAPRTMDSAKRRSQVSQPLEQQRKIQATRVY
jgi:hypothetical protein